MGRSLILGLFMFVFVMIVAGTSHGDVATNDPSLPPAGASPEPITGTAAVSATGWETTPKDPFALYDPGPPGTKTWSYADLTPDEQAWADRNSTAQDPTNWSAVTSAYNTAVAERAIQAAADAAAHQLGVVDPLAGTGVVP